MGGVWLVFLGTVICPGFWKIPISSNMPRRLGYYKMLGLKLISISEKVGVILVLCGGFFGLSQTCIVTCTPYAYAFVFLPIKKKKVSTCIWSKKKVSTCIWFRTWVPKSAWGV